MSEQCSGQVFRQIRYYQCGNKGKVERNGKWYCGIHDPVKVAEKRKAIDDAWDIKYKAQRAIDRQRDAAIKACTGIPTEALEAGVVGEMVEALRKLVPHAENGTVGLGGIKDVRRARAILAKLDKEIGE